jgi:FkbM family methyltransferase
VVALEPDPENRRQLERNLELNRMEGVAVVNQAAWSSSGPLGWHTDQHPVWRRASEGGALPSVEAVTLDDLVSHLGLERVDWVKMDIEGAEVKALHGMRSVIARFHPTFFIEVHNTLDAVKELLAEQGYRLERESFDTPQQRHGWVLMSHSSG